MKRILLIDDVHPLFYNTFKSWSWEVIDGKNWDIQKLHSEIEKKTLQKNKKQTHTNHKKTKKQHNKTKHIQNKHEEKS